MILGGSLLASAFTSPIVLATAQQTVAGGGVIFNTLHGAFMPYVWDIARVLLYLGCIQGIYYIMRADKKQAVDKIKYAGMGYIMIRFIDVFIKLVDGIANGMTVG